MGMKFIYFWTKLKSKAKKEDYLIILTFDLKAFFLTQGGNVE